MRGPQKEKTAAKGGGLAGRSTGIDLAFRWKAVKGHLIFNTAPVKYFRGVGTFKA